MTTATGLLAPLRRADCRWLATALAVSQLGDWLYGVALAVFVYDRTGSAGWVAGAAIARLVPYVLLSPYGGVLADRLPRIPLMIGSNLLQAAAMLALAAVVFGNGPVVLAVLLATASVCCATPYVSATQASIPDLVSADELAATNTLASVIENVAIVAGPVAAVGLLALGSPGVAFLVNAATFVLAALALSQIRARSQAGGAGEAQSTWRRLTAGARALAGTRAAAVCLAFSAVAYLLYGVDTVLFVVVSTQSLGAGASGLGYLLAALGAGGVLVAVVVNRLAASPALVSVLTAATVVYGVPLAALALVHSMLPALLLIIVHGAAFVVIDVVAVTALQRLVPGDVLARVFGIFGSVLVGATVIGAAVVPPVVGGVGLDAALLGFGLVFPVLALLAYPTLRPLDRAAREQARALAHRLDMLQALPILAAASRPALERLAAEAVAESVPRSAVVLRQGDPAQAFYAVERGALVVTSTGECGGTPRELTALGPGDYFGEIGLLAGIPRTAGVTATEDTVLYRISGEVFLAALHDSPAATRALRDRAVGRLSRTHPTQVGLLTDPASAAGGMP